MFKWMNWIVRIAATALLLSFLSIWTTGYIVNSYMETLLKQLDLPLQTQPFALSGVWGKLWGASQTPKAEESSAAESRPPAADSQGGSESALPSPAAGPSPAVSGDDLKNALPTESPNPAGEEDSVPAFGGKAGILDMNEQQRQTLNEVMAKLNAEQLGKLSAYVEGGVTPEELDALGKLLKPSLSILEYEQMMELLGGRVVVPGTSPGAASAGPSVEPSSKPLDEPQ